MLIFDMPIVLIRSMSKEELEKTEQESFEKWVKSVHEKYGEQVAHFEHNLEVRSYCLGSQIWEHQHDLLSWDCSKANKYISSLKIKL